MKIQLNLQDFRIEGFRLEDIFNRQSTTSQVSGLRAFNF